METKIYSASAYIDFYVNKLRYDRLKTEKGRHNFIANSLNAIIAKHFNKPKFINKIEVRSVKHTPVGEYVRINDLRYSEHNMCPEIADKLAFRAFNIQVLGLVKASEFAPTKEYFLEVNKRDIYLRVSSFSLY